MTTMNPPESNLVIMCGLPASGKTTTSVRLCAQLGGVLIRSCDIYQELGIVVSEWVSRTKGFTVGLGEYDRLRDLAYDRMAIRVDEFLTNRSSWVFVDFAHPDLNKRMVLYELCAGCRAHAVVLLCQCDDFREVQRRFSARRGREAQPEHEASDLSVYKDIQRRWQSPVSDVLSDGTRPTLLLHDTLAGTIAVLNAPIPGVTDRILAALAAPQKG